MKLPNNFFKKPTLQVAKNLLGCILVNGKTSGIIVETEAYLKDDPASHSFNGKTSRNQIMFGEAGKTYIYFTYGMHHCFNVVTNKKGIGEAVLIRALQPLAGIELMKRRRKTQDIYNLCSGPAKLVQALAIKKKQNNHDLTKPPLLIIFPNKKQKFKIVQTKRIGISRGKSLLYRFYILNNKFISK